MGQGRKRDGRNSTGEGRERLESSERQTDRHTDRDREREREIEIEREGKITGKDHLVK